MEESRKILSEIGRSVDLHIITHYHFDHYCPDCDFYEGKPILGKDWRENINKSQRKRFSMFIWKDNVQPADGTVRQFGSTRIEFSPPVYHGEPETKLGWVIMVYIEENLGFLYTSDVEGALDDRAFEWILSKEPDILYIDGPLSYIKGYRIGTKVVEEAWRRTEELANKIDRIIIDHHAARDPSFYERINEMGIQTASEYHFGDDLPLEAWRKELWRGLEVPRDEVTRRYKL